MGIIISSPGTEQQPRKIFSHVDLDGVKATSVIEGPWKLVRREAPNGRRGRVLLYHTELDAGERTDLSHERPIVARYLLSQIMKPESAESQLDQRDTLVDEGLQRKLRALGYLH